MSARLITKCPHCKRITSDCIDHDATADREEFSKHRCKICVATTTTAGKPKRKSLPHHATGKVRPLRLRPASVHVHPSNIIEILPVTKVGRYGLEF